MFFILNRLWTSLKKFVPQKKKKGSIHTVGTNCLSMQCFIWYFSTKHFLYLSWTIFHSIPLPFNPNLIPSLPNLPPMFPPFPPFPDTPLLRRSVTRHSLLRHPPPVTRHIVTPSFHRCYSSLSVSVITVLRYFRSLPPLLSSKHHSRLCGWMITI